MTHKSFEERNRNDIWVGLLCGSSVRCECFKILSVISLTGELSITRKQSGWNNPRQTTAAKIAQLACNASFAWGEIRDSMCETMAHA